VAGCLPPQPGIVFRPLPEGRCAGDTSSHRRTPPPPPGPSPWPYHRRLEILRVPQAIGTGPWNRDEHGQGFWRGVKVQVVGPPQSKGGPRALGSGGALEVHHGRPTGGAGMKVRGLLCLPLEGWLTGLKSPDALRPPLLPPVHDGIDHFETFQHRVHSQRGHPRSTWTGLRYLVAGNMGKVPAGLDTADRWCMIVNS
jgi:hypothetical protein